MNSLWRHAKPFLHLCNSCVLRMKPRALLTLQEAQFLDHERSIAFSNPLAEAQLSETVCHKTEEPLPHRVNFYVSLETENLFLKSTALLRVYYITKFCSFLTRQVFHMSALIDESFICTTVFLKYIFSVKVKSNGQNSAELNQLLLITPQAQ